jgi:carbamate kinase
MKDMEKKLAVVALGGNALQRSNEKGTIEEQIRNTEETMKNVLMLMEEGYNFVISHGNGPQVGTILLQNDAGESTYNLPQMPIDVAVAQTQGSIAYLLEKAFRNNLAKKGIKKDIVSLITMVEVDKNDPAFKNPTKRVGKIYSKEEADKLSKEKGWIFKEEKKEITGWRRVVPSPRPLDILNKKTIKYLTESGIMVIASGGGGIPVYIENGQIKPVEAVIDKDLASSLMATLIGAEELFILTDVPFVYLDYGTEKQKELEHLSVEDAKRYLSERKFGEGSMAPKIRAAIQFIENGGKKAIITEATKLHDKKYGTKITLTY